MAGSSACGARTGLEVDEIDGSAALQGSGQNPDAAVGVYCAFHVGPVPSLDIPLYEGPVMKCSAAESCVDIGGQWLCCSGTGPHYDGMNGSCAVP